MLDTLPGCSQLPRGHDDFASGIRAVSLAASGRHLAESKVSQLGLVIATVWLKLGRLGGRGGMPFTWSCGPVPSSRPARHSHAGCRAATDGLVIVWGWEAASAGSFCSRCSMVAACRMIRASP